MRTSAITFFTILGLAGVSCSQPKAPAQAPSAYDLTAPVKYNMPDDLLEISGITFHKGDAATIFAEQDEDGKVFYFKPGDKQVKNAKFGKHGDYEDIAIAGDNIIILRSDGTFYTFPVQDVLSAEVKDVKEQKGLLPKSEYEGLYADGNKLYVLCKQCGSHTKKCDGYVFNVAADGAISQAGNFSIDVKKIAALEGKDGKYRFHPSALAKHPLTKQWYVLSSVNKLLVVTDEQFNVQAAYQLNPTLFLQPEGIAFDKTGNLYISNEGDTLSPGTILLFKYKQ